MGCQCQLGVSFNIPVPFLGGNLVFRIPKEIRTTNDMQVVSHGRCYATDENGTTSPSSSAAFTSKVIHCAIVAECSFRRWP